ncbi:hypothetical protein ACOACO_07010 [Nocardioides sp. CPCC 205120]|uniref:hypothetical protein n=1 Tax=Nocardioides sp. CPCC 205120 TaxID=3406462 RepID=UPI003B500107
MSLRLPSGRRAGALALAAVTAAGVTATALPAATAVPAGAPATSAAASAAAAAATARFDAAPQAAAAAWLADQLTDGIVVSSYEDYSTGETFSFDDHGLTVDVASALQAAGDDETVAQVVAALEPHVAEYTAYDGFVSGGSTAKLVSFLLDAGVDPTTYGETDLVAQLEGRVATEGATAGRVSDDFDPSDEYGGDYVNTFGQAYAVDALVGAGSPLADEATSFLLDQQCGDGSFRLYFSDAAEPDQTCDGAGDVGSTDATALSVLALLATDGSDEDVDAAVDGAATWLLETQLANGAFDDGEDIGANANSTGLAGRALQALRNLEGNPFGIGGAPERAAKWLREHQVAEVATCVSALRDDNGAIGYDDATLAAGRAEGITPTGSEYQFRLATAQAAPALASAPAATAGLGLRSPAGRVQAGSALRLTVGGLAPGESACVVGGQAPVRATGTSATIRVPRGTALRNIYVGTLDESRRIQVWALDAATFAIANTRTVRRGGEVQLKLAGLAPGEPFTVTYRGQARRAGTADAAGRATLSFVGSLTTGTFGLGVTGQFANRTATSSFVVVP